MKEKVPKPGIFAMGRAWEQTCLFNKRSKGPEARNSPVAQLYNESKLCAQEENDI